MSSNYGFIFDYNKRLSKSKPLSEKELTNINARNRNNDDVVLVVRCKTCCEVMNFHVGPSDCLDGMWQCNVCGSKVRERTIYSQLERENEMGIYEFDEADITSGCESCGGPWPDCMSSCSIYDD